MTKTLKQSRKELFEEELVGKTSAGRIYRKIRNQDKEFIRMLKEEVEDSQYDYANLQHVMKDKVIEIIDKLTGYKNE